MLYTTHHGEGGLGAPGCPQSDTCLRRKVAQRWPSNPSCEIVPHSSLVFSQIDPSSFVIRTRRPYFFCKKPALSTLPIATCPLPPRLPSRRLPAVTALHPSPFPSPRRRRPSPSRTLPPSLPMPPQRAALRPPWRAQMADLGRRRRDEAMGGGSGPVALRWIGGRRIRAAVSRRCSGRQIRVTAWSGRRIQTLVSKRWRRRRRWCQGVSANGGDIQKETRVAGTPGGVHRRAVPCFLFSHNFPVFPQFSPFQFLFMFSSYAASAFFT